MKTYKNLYYKIYKIENLLLAFYLARKGKTKKEYVKHFEENLLENLQALQFELMTQTYKPREMKTFILRDPKTRKISKSDFRDRIIHHAICNITEPIFQKTFIFDSCANQKEKGNLFAIKRFEKFRRKVTNNFSSCGYCLKADIKHYFPEVNHNILLKILQKKIKDEKTIWLIWQILHLRETAKPITSGMPLGNLTSQFFANVYLNELDYFVKHFLKVKYHIRYVDDFVILHKSKEQLKIWKKEIENFLNKKLKLNLHSDKTKIYTLSRGIDFVGFRNFYYFKLLRKRNIKNMERKINLFKEGRISLENFAEIFQGWSAYASWTNSKNVIQRLINKKINIF
ncbi:MAG: reverse transcriptase domain-containing protein [archaeon]